MPHAQASGQGTLSPLQTALQLAEEYGYKVFPCNADKQPLTSHGFKDASSNRQQIEDWWTQYPEALVGVPTGKVNDLFVVDVDPQGMSWYDAHREALQYWRIHRTRRGLHLLYHLAGKKFTNTAGLIAPGVDTRGEGGYVIWWPAAGLEVWTDGTEDAAPPVPEKPPPLRKANGNGQINEGARHSALLREASRLRHAGINGAAFTAALLAWNQENCNPPQNEADVVRIAADYLTKPEDKDLAQQLEAAKHPNLRAMRALDSAVLPPKTPVIHEMLYPGAWLVVGRPKIGKSWNLLQLAVAVAEGGTYLGYQCTQHEVLAVFGEDDDARIQSRLRRLGVAATPPGIWLVNSEELRQLPTQYPALTFDQWLDQYLEGNPRVKLVLLDTETTIRQTWTAQVQHNNLRITDLDYWQVRPFDDIGRRHNAAVLLVNHSSKQRGVKWTDPHELINRSLTALAGASGSMVLADPPDVDPLADDQTRVFAVRGRDLEHTLLLAVHQEKELAHFVNDGPYVLVRQSQAQAEMLEALLQLGDESEDQYISSKAIAAECGKSAANVQRTLSRMLKAGHKTWKTYTVTAKRGKAGGFQLVSNVSNVSNAEDREMQTQPPGIHTYSSIAALAAGSPIEEIEERKV